MNISKQLSAGAIVALTMISSVSNGYAQGSIVYDNSRFYQGQYYGTSVEFGDQLILSATNATLTELKFDYYLSPTASGNETANVRIYLNNGENGTPGTPIFETGEFNLAADPSGFNTVTDSLLLNVPETITWTVLFGGIDANEQAGLLFYNPPIVGASFDDYWERVDNVWVAKRFSTTGGPVANFGVQLSAVPEPSTVALGLLGAAVWGGLTLRRRYFSK